MRQRWVLPVLVLAVLAVGIWGYAQYAGRLQWENRVESQYQRAFSDLTNNLGGLETQLAKASVSESPRFLRQTLADTWRLAYAAQEKLAQLPIGAVELTRMKMLLAKVGTFCFQVIDRPAEALRLTEKEWENLQGLRGQARYVSGQITSMQANIVQNNLRWVDVDRLGGARLTAAALARRLGTNKLTKSLTMVENGLRRMPSPGFADSNVIYTPKPKGLTGRRISSAEGARIAARFIGGPAAQFNVRYLGRVRGVMASYLYSATPRRGRAAPVRVSVTEKGGHVAWMLHERTPQARRIDLSQATDAALRFLRERGLPEMAVVAREEFGGIDIITAAPREDGVICYPEAVKVQVAMDTGQVVGYEGVSYLTFHDPARSMTARLTAEQAKARVSRRLAVEGVRRTVIVDDRDEKLCYEVEGKMKGERFLVYIDAQDGTEVKIRRVDENGVEIE